MVRSVRRVGIALLIVGCILFASVVAQAGNPTAQHTPSMRIPHGNLHGFRAVFAARYVFSGIQKAFHDYGMDPVSRALQRDVRHVVGSALPFRTFAPGSPKATIEFALSLPRVRSALAQQFSGRRLSLIDPISRRATKRGSFVDAYEDAAWSGRLDQFYEEWFPRSTRLGAMVNDTRISSSDKDDAAIYERQFAGSQSALLGSAGNIHIMYNPQAGEAPLAPWRGEMILDEGKGGLWVHMRRHSEETGTPNPYWMHDAWLSTDFHSGVFEGDIVMMRGTNGYRLHVQGTNVGNKKKRKPLMISKAPINRDEVSYIFPGPTRNDLLSKIRYAFDGSIVDAKRAREWRPFLEDFSIAGGVKKFRNR